MSKINSRLLFIVFSAILFITATILLMSMDVEGILNPSFSEEQLQIVSIVKGYDAILGGLCTITRGYIINDAFVEDTTLFVQTIFRFDYLTFFFLILNVVSIVFTYLFFYRKRILLATMLINGVSLLGVSFQPQYFWIISGGIREFDNCFSPAYGNSIIGNGAIAFVPIMAIVFIYILGRVIYLFTKKVTIEY